MKKTVSMNMSIIMEKCAWLLLLAASLQVGAHSRKNIDEAYAGVLILDG